jgi:hypothetical protein
MAAGSDARHGHIAAILDFRLSSPRPVRMI